MRSNYSNLLCALLLAAVSAGQAAAQENGAHRTAADGKAAGRTVMDSATGEFGLSRIGQIAVSVRDLERATAFYRDKLGMRYLFTANGMAFFDNDGIRLRLTRLEGGRTNSVIYFKVDDIQEGYRMLSGRGVKCPECKRCHAGWRRRRYVPKTGRRYVTGADRAQRQMRRDDEG